MRLFALFLGVLLLATGLNGRQDELAQLAKEDFTSRDGFVPWAFAVIGAGSIGYIPGFRGLSNLFLILVVLAFVLRNDGVLTKFLSEFGLAPGQVGSSSSDKPGLFSSASRDDGFDETQFAIDAGKIALKLFAA